MHLYAFGKIESSHYMSGKAFGCRFHIGYQDRASLEVVAEREKAAGFECYLHDGPVIGRDNYPVAAAPELASAMARAGWLEPYTPTKKEREDALAAGLHHLTTQQLAKAVEWLGKYATTYGGTVDEPDLQTVAGWLRTNAAAVQGGCSIARVATMVALFDGEARFLTTLRGTLEWCRMEDEGHLVPADKVAGLIRDVLADIAGDEVGTDPFPSALRKALVRIATYQLDWIDFRV